LNDAQSKPVRCSECAFWRHKVAIDGSCHRHAPESGKNSEEVAHWPQTRRYQGCGDGEPATSPTPGSTCEFCVFWHRPAGGLRPFNRGDMPMSWWAQAGICVRHAPKPFSEPGARAFWRATSAAEGCGEGRPRNPDQTPAQ
jgi:hypothetical protein